MIGCVECQAAQNLVNDRKPAIRVSLDLLLSLVSLIELN